MIIDWQGKIYQCFSTKYWAHHIGLKADNNKALNMASIAIEIDAWGGLVRNVNLWYPAIWDDKLKQYVANTKVKPVANVQLYEQGFRGFYAYQKYTAEQIEAVRKLLKFWNEKYNIPLTYNPTMWDVSNDAIAGKSGVWSHVSFREDKSDCHPQKELVDMLKSLT
jgi:N-acetyl-anhydromuramyl-L-alanine amidase AmpD